MFGTTLTRTADANEIQKLMAEIARAPRNVRYTEMPNGEFVRTTRGDRKKLARQRGDARILGERDGSVLINPRYARPAAQQKAVLARAALAASTETFVKPKRVRKPAAAKAA